MLSHTSEPHLMMSVKVRVHRMGKHLKSVNTHMLTVRSRRLLKADSGWALYETPRKQIQTNTRADAHFETKAVICVSA